MPLQVTTVSTLEGLRALAPSWLDLLRRAGSVLPFAQPEWMSTWWACFRQDGALLRDTLATKVVRDEAGTLLGVAPLMLTERPAVGPLRARALGFLGADRYVTELRSPIVDPAREGEVTAALARHLLGEPSWDWMTWEGLVRGSEMARALERAMPLRWGATETGSVLTLAPTWDAFRGGLKRNIKESIRRCYNSLRRDGLVARLDVASDARAVDEALGVFLRLHAQRSRQPGGVEHPDRFADDGPRRFLREVCAHLSRRGIARVLTLSLGDRPVASRVAFALPGCLYLYYSGYDTAWGRYSVATTLVVEAIRYAIAQGIQRVHLSMGQDVSKARWGPETTETHQAIWVHPRLSSRVALKAYDWGRQTTSLGRVLGSVLPKRRFD